MVSGGNKKISKVSDFGYASRKSLQFHAGRRLFESDCILQIKLKNDRQQFAALGGP